MKKYFEYPMNDEIKQKIFNFYENVDTSMNTIQMSRKTKIKLEKILEKVSLDKKDIVLDVGCSRGELLKLIHLQIAEGIGIDLSNNIIDANNRENDLDNIRYEVFDGEHINLPAQVDKICLLDVLEHAFKPEILIKSIYENLQGGGILILQVPSTGWLSELVFGKYHMGHLRYYDPNSIKEFLEKYNFKIQSIEVYNAVPAGVFMLKRGTKLYRFMDKLCNFIPPRIYPYFGSILVVCKK